MALQFVKIIDTETKPCDIAGMSKDFFRTKMLVEIEVDTQFGPESATGLVRTLLNVPAVQSLVLEKIESNYVPASTSDANYNILHQTPRKLI